MAMILSPSVLLQSGKREHRVLKNSWTFKKEKEIV